MGVVDFIAKQSKLPMNDLSMLLRQICSWTKSGRGESDMLTECYFEFSGFNFVGHVGDDVSTQIRKIYSILKQR